MGFRKYGSAVGEQGIKFTALRPTARDPTGGIVLPPGDKAQDYYIEIFIRARDGIGGQTLSPPMFVQVRKLPYYWMKISTEFYLVTLVRVVKFKDLNISKVWYLKFTSTKLPLQGLAKSSNKQKLSSAKMSITKRQNINIKVFILYCSAIHNVTVFNHGDRS